MVKQQENMLLSNSIAAPHILIYITTLSIFKAVEKAPEFTYSIRYAKPDFVWMP